MSLTLTACDAGNYLGIAEDYALNIGEDVFGTGKTGVIGGELGAEPQSNDESVRFANYDIKKVEEAPKDEKVSYDFSGPENRGLTPTEVPVSTVAPNTSGSNITPGTVIVISAGHCGQQLDSVEPISKQSYRWAAMNFIHTSGVVNYVGGKTAGLQPTNGIGKDLCKQLGISYSGDDNQKMKAVAKALVKCGILVNGKQAKSKYRLAPCITSNDSDYYKKYRSHFETFVRAVNKSRIVKSSLWKVWASKHSNTTNFSTDTNKVFYTGNSCFFKRRATSGTASKIGGVEFTEHDINFAVAQQLANQLTSENYTVVLTKSDSTTTKLRNGKNFSNKNMTLMANNQKNALIHFVIHWDSNMGSGSGMHTYTPNNFAKSVKKKSAAAAKAMYDKDKSLTAKVKSVVSGKKMNGKNTPSDSYTTLNFAEIPTLIVECGWMTKSDFGRYVANGKFQANKFVKERKDYFLDAIKAVEKS